jgi:hypothetical protein
MYVCKREIETRKVEENPGKYIGMNAKPFSKNKKELHCAIYIL